tara:strand:+ start:34 stop:684 length:651 start_codon:yes stop_codon:yes gene_type:complete
MKKIFIETKYQGTVDLPKDLLNDLPQKVMVATTIQFIDCLREVKEKLSAFGKEVYFFQSMHSRTPGQILGCDNFKIKSGIEAFLYIGDGEFHPTALLANELPIFCFNPLSEQWKKFGRKEWEQAKLKKKVALMKFHSASKVGILVSIKAKQRFLQGPAGKLKEELERKGKEVYVFLGNELNEFSLNNYPFIECWVNTACPRISDDVEGMVNFRDLE